MVVGDIIEQDGIECRVTSVEAETLEDGTTIEHITTEPVSE